MNITGGRGLVYLAGIIASGMALAGYADFDPETWTLDIRPFQLDDAVKAAVSGAGNALAAVAVWRGWGKR